MSKNLYVWVVERNVGGFWLPMAHETAESRATARLWAAGRRRGGMDVRVRKYMRAGK